MKLAQKIVIGICTWFGTLFLANAFTPMQSVLNLGVLHITYAGMLAIVLATYAMVKLKV